MPQKPDSYYQRYKRGYCQCVLGKHGHEQPCGKREGMNRIALHVHHIDRDRNNNEPENLITLCTNCHRFVHGEQKHYRDRNEHNKFARMVLRELGETE